MGQFSFECSECGGLEQFDWPSSVIIGLEVLRTRPMLPQPLAREPVYEAAAAPFSAADFVAMPAGELAKLAARLHSSFDDDNACEADRELHAAIKAWADEAGVDPNFAEDNSSEDGEGSVMESGLDLGSMKVVELRDELERRGLDKKGLKVRLPPRAAAAAA